MFDYLTLSEYRLLSTKIHISGRDIVERFVIAFVVIVRHKIGKSQLKLPREKEDIEFDNRFHGAMVTFDLALGLRMIWGTTDMIHLPVFQPIGQVVRDVTRPVVAEQARLVQNRHLITT